jgi:predicted amidohydrolase
MDTVTAAVVQATPVFLHREVTVDKVVRLMGEAAERRARVIAFPEAFVPGYPEWVWRLRPWGGPSAALYGRLLEQAVEVPGPVTLRLGRAAADAGAYVTIGVNERHEKGVDRWRTSRSCIGERSRGSVNASVRSATISGTCPRRAPTGTCARSSTI